MFKVVQVSQSSALVLCLILCWSTLYRQLRRWNRLELFMPGFLRSGSSQIPIPRFCPISQSNFYFVESSILVLVKTQFLDGQTIVFFVCFFVCFVCFCCFKLHTNWFWFVPTFEIFITGIHVPNVSWSSPSPQ